MESFFWNRLVGPVPTGGLLFFKNIASRLEELGWIQVSTLGDHLVVQVRSGASPGVAKKADLITKANLLSLLYLNLV